MLSYHDTRFLVILRLIFLGQTQFPIFCWTLSFLHVSCLAAQVPCTWSLTYTITHTQAHTLTHLHIHSHTHTLTRILSSLPHKFPRSNSKIHETRYFSYSDYLCILVSCWSWGFKSRKWSGRCRYMSWLKLQIFRYTHYIPFLFLALRFFPHSFGTYKALAMTFNLVFSRQAWSFFSKET
jgi:hypothetical protein